MTRLIALQALVDLELSAAPCHDSCHAPQRCPARRSSFRQGFCTAELSRSLETRRRLRRRWPGVSAGRALGGSPGARRATHRQDTQIEAALTARRPRAEDANRELPVAMANLMKYMEEQGMEFGHTSAVTAVERGLGATRVRVEFAEGFMTGRGTPGRACGCLPGGHGEVLRGSRGDAAGAELGSSFVERIAVNTGTVPVCPVARGQRAGPGWARCRLTGLGRGGAPGLHHPRGTVEADHGRRDRAWSGCSLSRRGWTSTCARSQVAVRARSSGRRDCSTRARSRRLSSIRSRRRRLAAEPGRF